MIIVGYVYNSNGMATWCYETAAALSKAGYVVGLVKSKGVIVPNQFVSLNIFEFDQTQISEDSLLNKVKSKFWISTKNNFLLELHQFLLSHGVKPSLYLLNQSNLINVAVPVPTMTVAWSYPFQLFGYLKKAFIQAHNFKSLFYSIKDALYWFLSDKKSYQEATYILAVTKLLADNISQQGIPNTIALYPCYTGHIYNEVKEFTELKIILVALDLEQKRKNITFLLNVLSEMIEQAYPISVTAVGECSDSFKQRFDKITFKGRVSRTQLIEIYRESNLLVFGSSLDDFGYVQIEAMAEGLLVLAPNAYPSNELIADENLLYNSNNADDLRKKIEFLLNKSSYISAHKALSNRFEQNFTPKSFVKQFQQYINAAVNTSGHMQ